MTRTDDMEGQDDQNDKRGSGVLAAWRSRCGVSNVGNLPGLSLAELSYTSGLPIFARQSWSAWLRNAVAGDDC